MKWRKNMKPEYLQQLTEKMPEHPHITGDKRLEHDEWCRQNQPYVWLNNPCVYEEGFSATQPGYLRLKLFTDVGHGFYCVFINGKYILTFKEERVFSHDGETYLVVNGPSYGIGEYAAIFKLMEKK
jgi:hypothetical protein